jgi:trans-aconitate methyltransferase
MEKFDRKKHWENIYRTKELKDFSWYQSEPATSLKIITDLKIPETAKIIDIGGGDSLLTDHLLALGYKDISVLDISEASLERAKQRLGSLSNKIKWIVSDASAFKTKEKYDLWHDRATFHFLTDEQEIKNYIETAWQSLNPAGILIIATFSEQGPKKCSGIEIKQYSETSMTNLFGKYFEKIECITIDHKTPFNTTQNFIFCVFRRIKTL